MNNTKEKEFNIEQNVSVEIDGNYDWREEAQKLINWKKPDSIPTEDILPTEIKKQKNTLSINEMLPTKFQPICKRHFVFICDGIDAFLVKNVKRPSLVKDSAGNFKPNGYLEVVLHEAIAPSAMQQVIEWATGTVPVRQAKLEFLDPVGTIIQRTNYKNVKLEKVERSSASYNDSGISEITVYLSYESEELEF